MAIENFGGLGPYDVPDRYSEEDKKIVRKRILLQEPLDYQKLHEYKPLISVLKSEHLQEHGEEFTGDVRELVDDYAWDMSWFESNEASTFFTAAEERTDQQDYDLGLKIHIWDRVHNRDWWKIAKDHTAAIVTSPSSVASALIFPLTWGAGSVWLKGGTVAAQQVAKQAIKQHFLKTMTGAVKKNIHKNIVKGVLGEGAIEGIGAGTREFYRQDVQQQALSPETMAPMREEKNYDDILVQSAIGFTAGVVIPSVLYGAGKGLKSVLKREMAQTIDQPFGRTPFEELRIVQPAKKTMINNIFGNKIVQRIKAGLTSSAGMPQQLADIHTNNLRKLTAMEEDISRNISDFEVIFKKETGKDFNTLSEKEMMPYYELLHGKDKLAESMPNAISDQINLMRTKIADTSQYALDSGMIKDAKLRKTIEAGVQNKNYVNYSYRLHDDTAWAEKLTLAEKARYDKAFEFLEGLGLEGLKTKREIKTILSSIISGSLQKTKILGIFKGKQKIPDEIRELMGQHVDVRDVYKHTIGKIHSATSEYEFRTAFAEMGGDLGILSKKAALGLTPLKSTERPFSLTKEGLRDFVEGDLEKVATNPFDGVYANKTFMNAYNTMRGETARLGEAGNPITGTLSGLSGIFSIGHTAYSPMTVSRNVTGGGIINLAAGNWINPIQRALNTSQTGKMAWNDSEMTSFSSLIKRLKRGSALNEEDLILIREAISHGMLQQGVRAEVLHRNLKDLSALGATVRNIERNVERGNKWYHKIPREAKRKGFDPVIKFYGMMDDVNKLWAWDTEFRTFKHAYGNSEGRYFIPKRLAMSSRYGGVSISDPSRRGAETTLGIYAKSFGDTVEVSEAVLKGMAAKKATMYYPTYDQIPKYIKDLRKVALGNFIAFPTEMIRTTKNSVMLGLEEIYSGNRIMAARGMTRLASTTAVAGGFGGGALGLTSLGLSYITGQSEIGASSEKVDAFRRLQTYTPGGNFIFHSIGVGGDKHVIKATNTGYSDPFNMFKDPLRVAMLKYQEGASLEDTQSQFLSALGAGAEEFLEPYIGVKEAAKALFALATSDNDMERDYAMEKMYKTFTPVLFQDVAKYSIPAITDVPKTEWGTNVPKLIDYLAGIAKGGLKQQEYDLDMMASRKIAEFQKDSTNAYASFRKLISHVGKKNKLSSIPEMQEAYREAIRKDIDIQKQKWGVVRDMRIWNMSDLHIKNVLMQKYDITRKYQKRLSGRKMSDDNAINFLSVRPLYFVKTLESFQKPLEGLIDPIYDALKIVEDEYSRSRILLNE